MALFREIAPRAGASSAPFPAGGRVLVAADDPDVRRLLQLVLGLAAVDADAAPHADAMERLKRRDYGCILLDVSADLHGLDTLRALRDAWPGHIARTIVLTIRPRDLLGGFDIGVYRVFSKPLVMRELMETITECLGAAVGAA